MKKTLIVAAVSALSTLIVGTAFAQSSVTVYGRFNTTAERTTVQNFNAAGNKTNSYSIKYLNNNASRIGFKGTEDLGSGLKANFILENGFDSSSGVAASAFWGRQSELNLQGGFGMVRLGNFTSEAYFATADYISMHNHDTGNSEDKLYAYLGRNRNKIAYRTPEFVKGWTAEAAVTAGEAANTFRTYDLAINGAIGPVALGLGYEKADADKQFGIRALYEAGPFAFGTYLQRHTDGVKGNRTLFRLSGAYTLGASEFHINVGKAGEFSKLKKTDAKQFTLGYNYNLSKRTKVYGYYTKVDDAQGTSNGLASGISRSVSIGDQTSIAAGVRHNF
jgi:predicted porin